LHKQSILKQKKIDKNKKYIFFYLILIYLLSFLFWWTYLLYQKTENHYDDALKYQILLHTSEYSPIGNYLNSEAYEKQQKNFHREKVMIITEGLVFSIILLFLLYKVKKSVEHEIEMSQQQQNFILSITHELKSPLSSIKLMSQTLARHNLKEEQKNKLVKNSLNEVDRLQNLVENILLAAKLDNNSYGFFKKEINFSDLVKSLVRQCETSNDAIVKYEIEDNIMIEADISGMTSVIINLIENAIKYSDDGSIVYVLLHKEEGIISLKVIDEGVGIIEEEREKIFDKFYRVGNEEVRSSKGTGLGLYILKRMVEFHNGTIKVHSNKPKGSIFEINFEV